MGLIVETWSIAYRKRNKQNNILTDSAPFSVIKNKYSYWSADPFLFKYNNKTYLFAEQFSFKINRGQIVYAVFDEEKNKFSPFKEIIREDYHLSYPVVFEYKGKIYMMPEANQSNGLYMYEAVSFPDKWKKLPAVMSSVKVADTTPTIKNGKLYAETLEITNSATAEGSLTVLEFDDQNKVFNKVKVITKDMSVARPGGNFIDTKESLIRVSQDCKNSYGDALNLISVDGSTFEDKKLIKRFTCSDVSFSQKVSPNGIHTYNLSEDFEVIDLKFYKSSIYHIICKFLRPFRK